MKLKKLVFFVLTSAIVICFHGSFVNAGDKNTEYDDLWRLIKKGGYIVLLRHALAPGFGDPNDFIVADCLTQRNLNDAGRQQAKKIGDRFRQNGIEELQVFSSQWCRCLETAQLLNVGEVKELSILNSFFQQFERREQQTQELRQWLQSADLSKPTMLVTHQVNITALTGIVPRSGEMVIVSIDDAEKVVVHGTVITDINSTVDY